jgi:hypothetical protein
MAIYKRKYGIDRQQTGFGPGKGDGGDKLRHRFLAFPALPEST